MRRTEQIRPNARREGVIVQELADDLLVYDLENHRAHCLNNLAAVVWKNCDGERTIGDVAGAVGKVLNQEIDEEIVLLALDQLGKAKLLEERIASRPDKLRMSRREMMRKAGIAAMIAIPAVTSILAPEALASAASCGTMCTLDSECFGAPAGCQGCSVGGRCVDPI